MKKAYILLGTGILGLVLFASMLIGSAFERRALAQASAQVFDCTILENNPDGRLRMSCTLLEETPTETPADTDTPSPTDTDTPSPTDIDTPTPTDAPTATSTDTPTFTPTPTSTPGNISPFVNAPLCPSHDPTKWHGLWDAARGCHYDHEHGQNPFTAEVAAVFLDIKDFNGGLEVSHTNPSSPMEVTHKHGGYKWDINLAMPYGCAVGFEGGNVAVKGFSIQYHAFGRQDVELEVHAHSAEAFLELCKSSNPNDVGYLYINQLQEYGERVMPYQGMTLPYPNNFQPQWNGSFGPYFTVECFGQDFSVIEFNVSKFIDCRPSSGDPNNNLSKWTSKRTGGGPRPPATTLFNILFDVRDGYQRLDAQGGQGLTYPFSFRWVCGGTVYSPNACRFNNSATEIHEIKGIVPAAWDGLAGFDTDPRAGRITARGFVTSLGALNPGCTAAGENCYPIWMTGAFVGTYSSETYSPKVSNLTPQNTPERDIYFCGAVVCSETAPSAVPSGWIGENN